MTGRGKNYNNNKSLENEARVQEIMYKKNFIGFISV